MGVVLSQVVIHGSCNDIHGMLQLDEPPTGPVICIEVVNRRKTNQKTQRNVMYCNANNELVLLSFFLAHSKDRQGHGAPMYLE